MLQTGHPSTGVDLYQNVNFRTGDRIAKILLWGEENSPANFQFSYSWGKEDQTWETPRHHHNFEQLRHPVIGDYSIGKDEVIPEGWVGYISESVFYGPQVASAQLTMCTLQYGGPSGNGYWSLNQQRQGQIDLKQRGKFENGAYSWLDADGKRHNKDAGEAMWEHVFGKQIDYPPPRYNGILIMNPASFEWKKDREQKGVARKILGAFTERKTRVGFIRMEAGAELKFGGEPAQEIVFVKEGAMTHGGKSYPRLTAFGARAAAAPVTLKAIDPTELYYVKLPTFQ